MNTISFMSANYVARTLGYHMTEGWAQGDASTQAAFRPVATFAERFRAILQDVRALGFDAIDLWGAHLHPDWATPDHIAIARDLLQEFDLSVSSYAIFLRDIPYLESACVVMHALDIPLIGGGGELIEHDRAGLVRVLRDQGIRYAFENHPEETADALRAKIGAADADVVGIALDTGWFGTHGTSAPDAARALADRLMHIHLKDVLRAGEHECCAYGDGVVEIEATVRVLQEVGYTGGIAVEHEPELYDPTDEIAANFALLKGWLDTP